jgi:hypothetical protein
LLRLNLASNQIGYDATVKIIRELPNSSLTDLNLDSNNLKEIALRNLKDYLGDSKVRTLSLADNSLNAQVGGYIAASLRRSSLTYLNVSSNRMQPSSYFAKVIPHSPLIHFDISNNKLNAKSIAEFEKALPKSKLSCINVSQNLRNYSARHPAISCSLQYP